MAVLYKLDGKVTEDFPFALSDDSLEPDYQELDGWNCSLDGIQSFDNLPVKLSEYIRFIEKETGIPVKMVSIGPDRLQTLER